MESLKITQNLMRWHLIQHFINMPFWNDLSGDSEVIKDSGNLTAGKIGSSSDVARKQGRARMWGAMTFLRCFLVPILWRQLVSW